MEKDFISDLLGNIQAEFNANTKRSKVVKAKIEALKNKRVTHKDSNDFAIEVGNVLKDVFKDIIKSDVLPDNKMYYDVAKGILEPSLKNNYDLVVGYAGDVQDVLNRKAGINISKQIPKINQERIDNLVEKISEYDSFEDAKWLLDEPVVNFTQSIVDDVVKENVEFQYQSGLKPKIIRREAGSCCEWCSKLAGTYDYPEGVPKDVWRRHRFCRCTVEYVPGDGRRQNVHTKKWTDEKHEQIDKRKAFSEGKKLKTLKKDDIKTKNFASGSGKNYPVKIGPTEHVKIADDYIKSVTVIAGKGTSTRLKDVNRLSHIYNMPKNSWQKVSGITHIYHNNERVKVEIHWYEANGVRYEVKVGRFFTNES